MSLEAATAAAAASDKSSINQLLFFDLNLRSARTRTFDNGRSYANDSDGNRHT